MVGFNKREFVTWLKNYAEYDGLSHKAELAFSGWSGRDPNVVFENIREVISLLEEVVTIVERFSKDVDALSSKEKLEAAVTVVDDWIKLPFFAEWVDNIILRYMFVVIVEQKNKWFGKNWFDSVV